MSHRQPATPAPLAGGRPIATILLTGVGSGIGRSVLDALEGRREGLRVIGGDADGLAPGLASCDVRVTLPPSADAAFGEAVRGVCEKFDVDVVVPCRDPDLVALANEDGVPLLGPGSDAALMARDKYACSLWCEDRGIDFAATIATDVAEPGDIGAFASVHGFPLVAKPRSGSGSMGVRVIAEPHQLELAQKSPGLVFQPFLNPPPSAALSIDASVGIPLFWEVPCDDEPGVMALIGPDGEIGPHLCFTAEYRLGRIETIRTLEDPGLHAWAVTTIEAFARSGWRGPLNLGVRRGPAGWRIIEVNPRFSGGTAARLHLGLDELGWTLNAWLGAEVVPAHTGPVAKKVRRMHAEFPVMDPAAG